jgi:integrase
MSRSRLKIRHRKDRRGWEVDYRDGAGARRRPVFPTEEDAHAFATRLFKTLGRALPAAGRDLTLREYATRWLADIAVEKEPATVRCYAERLNGHVLPALGRLRLRELHRSQIKALLAEKRRQGYAKNGVRLMRAALSALLSDAVDDGIIDSNPALQLGRRKASRADKLSAVERLQKVRPMTWEQRDAFLEAAACERPYVTLFTLLAKAGLRPGESFALQPGDLNFREGTVRVERAWSRGSLKATKTSEARVVDLTPDLARALQRHLAWLKAEALRHGWGEPEWLFPNKAGQPFDKANAERAFHRIRKRAGLPHFRLYDLRHTYASLLLAAGAPITYVSAQLGHANPTTTLRYYAKWIPSRGQRWVNVLDRGAFGSKLEPKVEPKRGLIGADDPEVLKKVGSPGWTRTSDFLINSQALYQLSYRGTSRTDLIVPQGGGRTVQALAQLISRRPSRALESVT